MAPATTVRQPCAVAVSRVCVCDKMRLNVRWPLLTLAHPFTPCLPLRPLAHILSDTPTKHRAPMVMRVTAWLLTGAG